MILTAHFGRRVRRMRPLLAGWLLALAGFAGALNSTSSQNQLAILDPIPPASVIIGFPHDLPYFFASILPLLAKPAARARRRRRLKELDERLKLAVWSPGDEFWDWNLADQSIHRVADEQSLLLEQDLSGDIWHLHWVHPDDLPRVRKALEEHIAGASDVFESEYRRRGPNGEWRWVRSRGKIVARDGNGNPLRVVGSTRDTTANRRAEGESRIASEILRSMNEAVAIIDLDFRFVAVNPAFIRITGFCEEDLIGQPMAMLDGEQQSPGFCRQVRATLRSEGHWQGEMWQKSRDGEDFLAKIKVSDVRDLQGARTHYVMVANDITEMKRVEQELRYLANYDPLTGLPNRTLLSERLARAMVRARRENSHVAVLFLDLDRFKDINDSMGHAVGDRVLKATAARLQSSVREIDTVARLGGDEFTVVLEELDSPTAAEQIARKILTSFAEPLVTGRGDIQISPSIGISLYPDHGLEPADLLKAADTAMYEAKEQGRNTYKLYTETMDAEARQRALMISALRKALERHEFRLVYQPRLSLADGRITGVEALLRWHSEEIGEVPPAVFIPLAEETGMILTIGEWVLREACATLQRWRQDGLTDLSMAINVSVLQLLRGDLPEVLGRVLSEIVIPANRLELEVTESMVMANAEKATAVLNRLKELGVSLAIDDFGTGYSSLVYLKRLPIDTLKIDKEFIGDLTTDPDDEAITATMIAMAHSLGLNVIAEGVESWAQFNYLRDQSCDEIQGFWLSQPLDIHQCFRFIDTYQPGREMTRALFEPTSY